ncbi:uncharacterized protein AMSG_04628 [Thecamonas trahens ATCC 50062]|uniref:Uncharacterized protein n=1 Tax=Thecamonas trahens ATCC 50062 TaxID=461836 RepID=A0A0L0DC49_THETB|nr:hypothetical protein AMSG_04628 [Thecamonas trahens ATCC 50062]KNC48883.1 hypothetical protein AMSG_04628 [Thecamonas trahens ATCC 50062]|eukprot:XP_013758303.1 hypothetical protein AMSG_04628 [Thecamonas trahens ATCC 50062]
MAEAEVVAVVAVGRAAKWVAALGLQSGHGTKSVSVASVAVSGLEAAVGVAGVVVGQAGTGTASGAVVEAARSGSGGAIVVVEAGETGAVASGAAWARSAMEESVRVLVVAGESSPEDETNAALADVAVLAACGSADEARQRVMMVRARGNSEAQAAIVEALVAMAVAGVLSDRLLPTVWAFPQFPVVSARFARCDANRLGAGLRGALGLDESRASRVYTGFVSCRARATTRKAAAKVSETAVAASMELGVVAQCDGRVGLADGALMPLGTWLREPALAGHAEREAYFDAWLEGDAQSGRVFDAVVECVGFGLDACAVTDLHASWTTLAATLGDAMRVGDVGKYGEAVLAGAQAMCSEVGGWMKGLEAGL